MTIHFDAHGGESVADHGRGDGTIELVVFANAHGDGHHHAFELGSEVGGSGAEGVHAGLQLLAFEFKHADVGGSGQAGKLLRKQIVAAVAGLDIDDVAKVTELFNVGTKNNFHFVSYAVRCWSSS